MTKNDFSTKEGVYKFLQSHALGILSTVSADGTPYASPIYFIVDKELNFFFLTKSDTKKSQNILRNNHAALTVTHGSLPIAVQSTGTVEEVQDYDMFSEIAEANAQEKGGFSWPPPISKLRSEGYLLMYKFQPNWLRVGNFSESKDITETQQNIFHQIIPHKNTS